MTYTVKKVEFGDTVLLVNGAKYQAIDDEGRAAIFLIHIGDSVEVYDFGSEATMRASCGKEFKVRRV